MIFSCKQIESLNLKNIPTNYMIGGSIIAASIATAAYWYLKPSTQTTKINIVDASEVKLNFPATFHWGIGTSSGQVEDQLNNTWTDDRLREKEMHPSSFNCGSFTHWQDDIDKVAHLGCNSYRFSIEWSRVEPEEGHYNIESLRHYQKICRSLKSKNIQPMVCLHHYTDPTWFLENGGFAHKDNIEKFIQYINKVYEYLGDYVQLWIPISQPAAYAIKGYKGAMHPPFENNLQTAGTVTLNMLNAHVQAYELLKAKNVENQIGICHQIVHMQAARTWNPIDNIFATFADRLYNKSVLRFFSTGQFRWLCPKYTIEVNNKAPQSFDFFGLSYYSPLYFKGKVSCQINTNPMRSTEDPIRIICENGMYKAIQIAASLGKPVYIVENGINTQDENKRKFFFNSQVSAISKALADGYNVLGYYPWTLMDNYEWGYEVGAKHFGLYHNRMVSHTTMTHNWQSHETMLKAGGKHYQGIIKCQQ